MQANAARNLLILNVNYIAHKDSISLEVFKLAQK